MNAEMPIKKLSALEDAIGKYGSDPKYKGQLSRNYKQMFLEILEKKYPRHQKVVMLDFDFRGQSFL
jgi:hypothetical protein